MYKHLQTTNVEDGFNDGRVELFQQPLWQVELPQLPLEVQSLLGFFDNRVYGNVPLQVLGDNWFILIIK